jgi:hypothetical protein
MRRHLSAISYNGWLSIVQRPASGASPLEHVQAAVRGFNASYLNQFRSRRPFHV